MELTFSRNDLQPRGQLMEISSSLARLLNCGHKLLLIDHRSMFSYSFPFSLHFLDKQAILSTENDTSRTSTSSKRQRLHLKFVVILMFLDRPKCQKQESSNDDQQNIEQALNNRAVQLAVMRKLAIVLQVLSSKTKNIWKRLERKSDMKVANKIEIIQEAPLAWKHSCDPESKRATTSEC